MTTVIFVHGTGGRKPAYAITFDDIEKKLSQLNPEIKLVPCLWGEPHGTKLNANGASIPEYDSTGGTAKSNNKEVHPVQLWEQLYKNPLYEIQLLSLRPIRGQAAVPGKLTPSQKLRNKVNELTASSTLPTQLQQTGIAEVFDRSHQAVTQSNSYNRLLDTASASLDEDYAAIARAIVAQAIELCDQEFIDTPIRFDSEKRDKTVDSIYRELTNETSRGIIGDAIKNLVSSGLKSLGNRHLQRQRGALTDAAYPFSGDILLYQTKGEKIREFISQQIENVEPPVVLLAHSLGGIACVDLLVAQKLPQVKLLVTVGSQAPFLYEIDALQSLAYGKSLPEYFPKWLNIYDLRDILSYVGDRQGLFPGRIKDVKVDNQQPFPESHGAYWYNPATWDAILKELP
jgi:hypothetical protein